MVDYIVTDFKGEFVGIGDALRSADGLDTGVFGGVAGHDPEGGGMMIVIQGRGAQYAAYWDVDVDEIDDEPDFGDTWADSGYEDDYSGYYPEDEYNDLEHEYDDIY